ncbi:MAG: hypothetical protein JRD84_15120 [Deltaproteobacteria bacterium]|nr:hypothetical protein [Deltaproteobacteria bacterium]
MSQNLLLSIIKNELLDIVGYEDVTVREAERLAYSMDFYLIPQLWIDRHQELQKPDFTKKFHVFINWPPATGSR